MPEDPDIRFTLIGLGLVCAMVIRRLRLNGALSEDDCEKIFAEGLGMAARSRHPDVTRAVEAVSGAFEEAMRGDP